MSYDPTIGRWITEDPIGFQAADENLFRYVGNSPTNAVDPSGLQAKKLAEKATVVEISTKVIDEIIKKKMTSYPTVKIPLPKGGTATGSGPCAEFAKDMAAALKAKDIEFKLNFYTLTSGSTIEYTFPNGKKADILVNASQHIIVEVKCDSGGKTETVFFDAGAGIDGGGSLGKGNVGHFKTGVIAPENRDPKDKNTGKPLLKPFDPAKEKK